VKKPKWLLPEFVVAAHSMLLAEHGGPQGIRDNNILESALARPLNKNSYEPKSTVFQLAAAYSYGIAMNHPFVDGNKRTALLAGLVFLEINYVKFSVTEAEAANIFELLAAGEFDEDALGAWFEANSEV
jgi:death-on-curing protein